MPTLHIITRPHDQLALEAIARDPAPATILLLQDGVYIGVEATASTGGDSRKPVTLYGFVGLDSSPEEVEAFADAIVSDYEREQTPRVFAGEADVRARGIDCPHPLVDDAAVVDLIVEHDRVICWR